MKKLFTILFPFLFIFSFSFYQPIFHEDGNESMISVLIDGVAKASIPKKEDGYYIEKVECTDGSNGSWNYETWSLKISNLKNNRTKCNLSFKKIIIGESWIYPYTGNHQEFTVPYDGNYQIELWGARGGNGYSTFVNTAISKGGNGGYIVGKLLLKYKEHFYIHVGGKGLDSAQDKTYLGTVAGGYNGGGYGRTFDNKNSYVHNGAGGGGATHISLVNTLLKEIDINKNILLVAGAGGGGGGHEGFDIGGYGGGLIGGTGFREQWEINTGGTQSSGGTSQKSQWLDVLSENGSFGRGGNSASAGGGGGGGAGYYGGAGGVWNAGGGGSSFANTNNFAFSNVITKSGNETMPTYDGKSTMIGNENDGYAKITFLGK